MSCLGSEQCEAPREGAKDEWGPKEGTTAAQAEGQRFRREGRPEGESWCEVKRAAGDE